MDNRQQAEETQGMIAALTADYLNVYVIEPETDHGTIIKLDGYVINGIKETPRNFTYSKVLHTYAQDRVCDEDREEFLKTLLPKPLICSFADGREMLELNYRVPIDGRLEHYSGLYRRISQPGEELKIIAGFRNTENIISIQKKTRDEGLYSAYSAVSDLYLAMFRVDIKNNTYTSIKTTEAVQRHTIPGNSQYDENLKAIITALADAGSVDSALEFLDRHTVADRMRGKKHIATHFNGKYAGSCRLHLIRENAAEANAGTNTGANMGIEALPDGHSDAQQELRHVILAVEVLDDGEYQSVFDVLARGFQNVFLINAENGKAKILKLGGYITSGLDRENHKFFDYPTILKRYINERVYPDDQEMLYQKICLEHLREVFSEKDEYIGSYRVFVDGEMHHYQYNLSKPQGSENIVCGFQNVDDIIEEHLEADRKEKEKEAAHQKELEEQMSIINALSKSFRNVFVANLDDGMARVIRLADSYHVRAVRDVSNQEFPFDVVVKRWVEENVHPEDKERIAATLNIANIKKMFEVQDECVGTYRNIEDGVQHYYQYDIRRIGDTENVVAGFQIVDALIEERMAQVKKQQDLEEAHLNDVREHAEVISSLSTIYSTIFRVELDTHHYDVLNSVALMGEVAGSGGNFDDVQENVIEAFMAPEMRGPMRGFLDLDTLADRLKNVNTIVTEYRNPAGRWFQARFIVKRRDENGTAKEVLYVARDFTDEKEKELEQQDQLAQALAGAQQANKAKSTFLNSMSHDIRTPMNAIIGFTALAQTHITDQAQVQDYLTKISTSSTHLLSLINDILDMSRIESGTVKLEEKPLYIPDLLQDLRTMVQGLVGTKNLNLCIDSQGVIHENVIADKLRLNQILINIVGNAIKFTNPGGDIVVRLIEKSCMMKDYATFEFSVKDNGIGMSKEFQGHIFDTFSREYSSTVSGIQGTGLGMAITKNIVDMMGGDIQVESEEGKGSLFTVTLNLRLANEAESGGTETGETEQKGPSQVLPDVGTSAVDADRNTEQEERTKRSHDYSGKHILLVEDNELNREIAIAILEETGMTIDSVDDGDVAVTTINGAPADEYDLILMDIQMPKMDGYTATREIRTLPDNKKANIPIVAMTANAFEEDRQKAYASGMNGHIIKPISIEEITKVLDQVFAQKR